MEPVLYDLLFDIEEDHWWWRSRREIARTVLDRWMPGDGPFRLLDIGCGMGAWLRELPARFEGYGIDVSGKAVQGCRAKGMTRVILSDGASIPFESSFFHVISAFDVLEHLKDERPFLETVRRALADGGYFLATVPAFPRLYTRWDELNHHERRYTRQQLIETLERHGLQVKFCSYFHFWLFPLAVMRLLNEARSSREKKDLPLPAGARVPHPIFNRLLESIFSSEKFWLARENRFPWGSSLLIWAQKTRR